jgi:hypothetical protein
MSLLGRSPWRLADRPQYHDNVLLIMTDCNISRRQSGYHYQPRRLDSWRFERSDLYTTVDSIKSGRAPATAWRS